MQRRCLTARGYGRVELRSFTARRRGQGDQFLTTTTDDKPTAWPSWSVKWVRASRRAAPPPVRSPGSPAPPRPRWRHHRHARAPGREMAEGDAGDHARPEAEVGEKNREVGDAEAANQ